MIQYDAIAGSWSTASGKDQGAYDLLNKLEQWGTWKEVTGTGDTKTFKLTDRISIEFNNIAKNTSSTDGSSCEVKYLDANNNKISVPIFYVPGNSRYFCYKIIKGATDMIVKLLWSTETGQINVDKTQEGNHNIVICNVTNAITHNNSKGIMLPWNYNSSPTSTASSKKYGIARLITDDNVTDSNNTAGNTNGPITYFEGLDVVSEFYAAYSNCVSTSAKIMRQGASYHNGLVNFNGTIYYMCNDVMIEVTDEE